MHQRAHGAVIEIVEQRPPGDHDSIGGDIIVPTAIRLNGQELFTSSDHPVKIHEVSVKGGDCVLVTLTLFAKRVSIAHEEGDPGTRIPVYLTVGRGASHEVGTVDTANAIPALLREVADQMETEVEKATDRVEAT
jgi:hypothetical protein